MKGGGGCEEGQTENGQRCSRGELLSNRGAAFTVPPSFVFFFLLDSNYPVEK